MSDGALSRGASANGPDPFWLSPEFPLPTEDVRCPLKGDMFCSLDAFLAGTGRRDTAVGGGGRRAVDEVGGLMTS